MKNFGNSRKDSFLETIPVSSIESKNDTLSKRMKFNFSYFTKQDAGQNFNEWSEDQQNKLFTKLIDYSRESLEYWQRTGVGSGKKRHSIYVNYKEFPRNSDFIHPKHVPHEAEWGRFRLEQSVRLIGFTIPNQFHGTVHPQTGLVFDKNVFYVVFLDLNHQFYKSEPK